MSEPAKALPYLPVKAKTEDWCTPPEILDAIRDAFGGAIDLDPCSNPYSVVGAEHEVMLPSWQEPWDDLRRALPPPGLISPRGRRSITWGDGLEHPWAGNVFFNPPYSHVLMGRFMARAVRLARGGAGHAIGLVPSKTDVAVWHENVVAAPAVCFLKGRLRHLLPDGTPAQPATFSQSLVLWTSSRELVHRFALRLDGKVGDVMFHR